jgi:ribose-phosphate pyrophosphokinase
MGNAMARKESEMMGDDLSGMKLFVGNANQELGRKVAEHLGVAVGKMSVKTFSDGEIQIMIEESARGNDVFILQPTCEPTNDNLMELLIMLDGFRRASASRITVVLPYYGYARQDKKTKPREPITARLVADLISIAGAMRVVAVDLHAEQIQGFFDIPVDHLYAGPILGDYLVEQGYGGDDSLVVSPDVGGVARARSLAEMLKSGLAIIAKRRPEPNQVDIVEIIGDVAGKRCVMIDDMIDTGRSIVMGAEMLKARGAKEIIVCCTHPVLSGDAGRRLQDSCVTQVVTCDTIPIAQDKVFPKLVQLSCAPLLGEAIRRIHMNESVSTLFKQWR